MPKKPLARQHHHVTSFKTVSAGLVSRVLVSGVRQEVEGRAITLRAHGLRADVCVCRGEAERHDLRVLLSPL